jgi:hypothetical protein
MHSDTKKYNSAQAPVDREICQLLAEQIGWLSPEKSSGTTRTSSVGAGWRG